VVEGLVGQGLPLFGFVLDAILELSVQSWQWYFSAYLDLLWQQFAPSRSLAASLADKLVECIVHQLNVLVDFPHGLFGLRSQAEGHLHLGRRLFPSRLVV
jgi:hypothetical protein